MNNCCINDINEELMVYYGYIASGSASNVNKFVKNINTEITSGIKITELKISIDELEIPIKKININSN